MRSVIDKSGCLVVSKALRDELGLVPGTELEIEAVDGRLEVTARAGVPRAPRCARALAHRCDAAGPARRPPSDKPDAEPRNAVAKFGDIPLGELERMVDEIAAWQAASWEPAWR
jgi:hypothetical protein